MPFKFVYLCDLLEKLEYPYVRDTLILAGPVIQYTQKEIITWFQKHKNSLNEFAVDSGAVTMMLRPSAWTDRDYGLNADGLEHLLARALALTRLQCAELRKWRTAPDSVDLAIFVEKVMGTLERDVMKLHGKAVTVEEIDQILLRMASSNRGSSSEIRALAAEYSNNFCPIESLGSIFERLQPRDAKWLTRLLLKTTAPVNVPADFGLGSFQSKLPNVLKVHVELPSSTPVGIKLGSTGIRKAISPKNKRHASTPPRDSGPISSRQRMASPGEIVFKRGPLRPMGSMSIVNNHMSSPSRPVPQYNASRQTKTSPKPLPRSRKRSRGSSPGFIPFQQGILRPTKLHTIERNEVAVRSDSPAPVNQPKTLSNCSAGNDHLRQSIEKSRRFPVFDLGLLTPAPTPGSSDDKQVSTPTAPIISSNPALESPPPPRILTSPVPSQTPSRRPHSPLLAAGTGKCRMTSSTCPLANIIFLLAPETPISYLISGPLAWHGCRYLTSLAHLSDPSLPHYYDRQTRRKYRKVLLIESRKTEESIAYAKQIEGLELKRSKGQKAYVEVCDWRLLELVAKEHLGKNLGYNVWKRCWICAI